MIQLLLKLFGVWEQFQDFSDKQRIAQGEKKRQEREKAIGELDKAEKDEEIFDAQDKIVRNKPGVP